MKSFVILLVCLCSLSTVLLSQQSTTFRIKAGEDMESVLGKEIYIYPQFNDGVIRFRQGKVENAKFNFNMLNGEMQFLTPSGDTLSLAEEKTIDYIAIGNDSFRYDKGYIRQLATTGTVKLAVKKLIKLLDVQKISGYDQPTSTSAINSLNSYSTGIRTFKLNPREDLLLSREKVYLLGDRFNHFQLANKKTLHDLFPKKQLLIENYLKDKPVDFKNETDLLRLLTFLKDI